MTPDEDAGPERLVQATRGERKWLDVGFGLTPLSFSDVTGPDGSLSSHSELGSHMTFR